MLKLTVHDNRTLWVATCDGFDVASFDKCTASAKILDIDSLPDARQVLANNSWTSGGTFGSTDYCPLHQTGTKK